MNREVFFAEIRRSLFRNGLSQEQVRSIEEILAACDHFKVTDRRQRACVLANCYWETGPGRPECMTPVREGWTKSNESAIRAVTGLFDRRAIRTNYALPAPNGCSYYGRGFIQITWPDNYQELGKRLGVPLYDDPDRALEPNTAADIAVLGMRDGLFRKGHTLERYFGGGRAEWIASREIVNGDKNKVPKGTTKTIGQLVASYGIVFDKALEAAERADEPVPMPVPRPETVEQGDDVYDPRLPDPWLEHGGGVDVDLRDAPLPLPQFTDDFPLRLGSQGPRVRELQEMLTLRDYHCRVDGDLPVGGFGKLTLEKVNAWKSDNGLPVDDAGTVTRETFDHVGRSNMRPFSKERLETTVEDLRRDGDKPVGIIDTLKARFIWLLGIFGIGAAENETGIVDRLTTGRDSGLLRTALNFIGANRGTFIIVGVACVGVWYFTRRIEQSRVEEKRSGKVV
jgi:predicted chitinase